MDMNTSDLACEPHGIYPGGDVNIVRDRQGGAYEWKRLYSSVSKVVLHDCSMRVLSIRDCSGGDGLVRVARRLNVISTSQRYLLKWLSINQLEVRHT
jgi:hypothetical protein